MRVVEVRGLSFAYPSGPPVLRELALTLERGWRCLLLGQNGSGKTTLLDLLAGRHLIDDQVARVLGRPAFRDTTLVEEIAVLGGAFPFDVDVGVDEILARRPAADPERRAKLIQVLGVDVRWRMSRVSDGQRRRVQLLIGLLRPSSLLLLDEVTTDLDVVARTDLHAFLCEESETRGTTLLYATHVLDGLEDWATHLAWLEAGNIKWFGRIEELSELAALRREGAASPLYRLAERWLRSVR
jgi:CCR4-NOT complex subunit CAF16